MGDLVIALANLFLFLAVVFAGAFLVVYAVLSLIGIVASRFDIPAPYGVHKMVANHPDQVELTDAEEAAFEALRSNWDKA